VKNITRPFALQAKPFARGNSRAATRRAPAPEFGDGLRPRPPYGAPMTTAPKDLKVWQEAVALAGDVVKAMRAANRREIRALADRVMETALRIPVDVADGYVCPDAEAQRRHFRAARQALGQLETELAVVRQAGVISAPAAAQLAGRSAQTARLLHGYLLYVERQIEGTAARAG
jgi:four helix bundle protein